MRYAPHTGRGLFNALSLVYFLETGSWETLPGHAPVTNEKRWRNWKEFFTGSNALLGGHEICGCYRDET